MHNFIRKSACLWRLKGTLNSKILLFKRFPRQPHLFVPVRYCTTDEEDLDEMELKQIVKKLTSFASPNLAGSWDNVGLLVEPSPPHRVTSLLLTNDLTAPVMDEALQHKVDMILCYHPPVFVPLKCLTQSSWKERLIVQCIENRIAVFSPHTSHDAVKGGVNDWLIQPFEGKVEVIEQVFAHTYDTAGRYRLEFSAPNDIRDQITSIEGVTLMSTSSGSDDMTSTCVNCTDKGLNRALQILNHDPVKQTIQLLELKKPPIPEHGPGRLVKLNQPITVEETIQRVKSHLNLQYVRLALAVGTTKASEIKCIAMCAGSGSSVLHGVGADLYITGEMSHHEVLDATQRGRSVILCDHSNTERGFLGNLQKTLTDVFENKLTVIQSTADRDPLEIV